MKKLFVALLAASLPNLILAQDADSEPKSIRISELSLSLGGMNELNNQLSANDFKSIAPGSSILNLVNSLGLSSNNYSGNNAYYGTPFNVNMGIQFRKQSGKGYKTNPLWRVGFSNIGSSGYYTYWGKSERYTIDSLRNSNGSIVVPIDSFHQKTVSAGFRTNEFRLENSINFRTNPRGRWSLYAGLGLGIGFNYGSSANFYYSEYAQQSYYSTYSSQFQSFLNNSKTESIKVKNGNSVYAYMPLGIDFKLGKRREFWKRLNLLYEVRPNFVSRKVADLDRTFSSGIMQGAGFRVRW